MAGQIAGLISKEQTCKEMIEEMMDQAEKLLGRLLGTFGTALKQGVMNMSKIAFIFPGQGAQTCGMGKDFYEQTETGRKVFDKATELLGFSVPELCFEPNDRLDITEYTQAAMVTTSIAMMKVLEENGVKPDVAAGLSLGEYCALAAAGVMSEEDADHHCPSERYFHAGRGSGWRRRYGSYPGIGCSSNRRSDCRYGWCVDRKL